MRVTVQRVFTGVLATASATGLALALGAAPAHAGTNLTRLTEAGDGYTAYNASVFFNHVGEHFTLYDHKADGAGVRVSYFYQRPDDVWVYPGYLYHRGGAGTSTDFNMSILDGSTVWITVCLIDGDDLKENTCSSKDAIA
jgi:hypothetical protein